MRVLIAAALFASLLPAFTVGASPDGVAVGELLDVIGRVVIRASGLTRPARLAGRLHEGDLIEVAPGSSAQLVLLDNGAQFALAGGSVALVGRLRVTPRKGAPP